MPEMSPEWLESLKRQIRKPPEAQEEPPSQPEETAVPVTEAPPLGTGDQLTQLPIHSLMDFPNQPFRQYQEGEPKWTQLRDSIRQNGIIEPLLVRPWQDGYQIISGHNRRSAARSLGHFSVPVIVRRMNDDEAVIQLTTTNLVRREDLMPSEKAFAYRMRLEAMKRQGYRSDLTLSHAGTKLRSDEKLAETVGESRNQIQRFIRLTYLIPPLLELVDRQQLSIRPAVVLSYLSGDEQTTVYRFCFVDGRHNLTEAHAERLRSCVEAGGELTADRLTEVLVSQTPKPPKKVSVPVKSIKRYFKADASEQEIQETILKALEKYFEGKEAGG